MPPDLRRLLIPRARLRRLGWPRVLCLILILFFIIDLSHISFSGSPSAATQQPLPPDASYRNRIFIASIHWNNEKILRSHWNNALLDLVRTLGPENVYVTIFESGSWDNSKDALRTLDADLEKLGVAKKVVLDETTHKDEIERIPPEGEAGWIWTSRGKKELRRIPYLARLRNQVMDEMSRLANAKDGRKLTFDRVLWLNDVVFTTSDVLNLLDTRAGQYAAACSLDFSRPPLYYDTFALRDSSGAKPVTQTWPYFLSYKSRHALMSNRPVPVQSCWNGMVAFDATPFYDEDKLRFRGISDSLAKYHLEGSECCLIHVDNSLSTEKGVWLNPNVRVGYHGDAYKLVHPSDAASWPPSGEKISGVWQNRMSRLTSWPRRIVEGIVVRWRLSSWKSGNKTENEAGLHCLINEMQVLVANGWAHL